jgi:predicted RNase H-like nuclease
MRAVGVDGWRRGWVAVVLERGRFAGAVAGPALAELLAGCGSAEAIGVDMPIGLPPTGTRKADTRAKTLLGPRGGSVFYAAPRAALLAPLHADAVRICRELGCPGVSQQSHALREKILEVEQVALVDERLFEVHPEVSYLALSGSVLPSKRSWNGLRARLAALSSARIALPAVLDGAAGGVPAHDVVDAAVAAWSADRLARGVAECIPDPPERIGSRLAAIWY